MLGRGILFELFHVVFSYTKPGWFFLKKIFQTLNTFVGIQLNRGAHPLPKPPILI